MRRFPHTKSGRDGQLYSSFDLLATSRTLLLLSSCTQPSTAGDEPCSQCLLLSRTRIIYTVFQDGILLLMPKIGKRAGWAPNRGAARPADLRGCRASRPRRRRPAPRRPASLRRRCSPRPLRAFLCPASLEPKWRFKTSQCVQ